jgi:hypothetical protein
MEPFVLDNLNMKMDKPVCAQCSMPFDSEIDADDIMLRMKLAQMFDISSDMVTPGMLEDYKEKIKK